MYVIAEEKQLVTWRKKDIVYLLYLEFSIPHIQGQILGALGITIISYVFHWEEGSSTREVTSPPMTANFRNRLSYGCFQASQNLNFFKSWANIFYPSYPRILHLTCLPLRLISATCFSKHFNQCGSWTWNYVNYFLFDYSGLSHFPTAIMQILPVFFF